MDVRAELYQGLAEMLSMPPDWLALPAVEWPFFQSAVEFAKVSERARRPVMALAGVRAETLARRKERYRQVFNPASQPGICLYESQFFSGKLAGPETFVVERCYKAVGLESNSAELPDHASLELAFLAFLANQQAIEPGRAQQWQKLERQFIEKHAGRWLPALGQSLVHTQDLVYAPVGELLVILLDSVQHPSPARLRTRNILPYMVRPENCTLCGFCAQVCPTHALQVYETHTETALMIAPEKCFGCAKCIRICQEGSLKIQKEPMTRFPNDTAQVLYSSPRGECPTCGEATISQAELSYLVSKLGSQAWLEQCLNCRSH